MINKEDKADVRKHMGKALANKVAKVTNDRARSGKEMSLSDRQKMHNAKANKSSGQVPSAYLRADAAKGRNPFDLVTHINGKKIK